MAFMKTNRVDITVDGRTYNSLTDYGLAIENTDYIGAPVQNPTHLVFVPGRVAPLDLIDSIFGGQYFEYRPISITFGGLKPAEQWDAFMSDFRTRFEGKIVKLVFANDPEYYWTGRCSIEEFERTRSIGKFEFRIEHADPYKCKVTETIHEVIPMASGALQVCINDRMKCVPTFFATNPGTTVTLGDVTHELIPMREQKFSDIVLQPGDNDVIVTGTGGTVTITYREGRL